MVKNIHLSKMDALKVEIRKIHTDIFKMVKKVHLSEMDVFDHLEKVGPIGTSISC
jgi:hypothetical protein